MLNKRFEQFVKDIVGDEDFLALRTSKGFRHAMKEFDERVKTSYMGDDEEYIVNFPLSNLKDNPQHKISANTITLKGYDVAPVAQLYYLWLITLWQGCTPTDLPTAHHGDPEACG